MEPVISPLAVHVYELSRSKKEREELIDDVLDIMCRVKNLMSEHQDKWEIDLRIVWPNGKHIFNISAVDFSCGYDEKIARVTGMIVELLDDTWTGKKDQKVSIEVRYLQEEFFSQLSHYTKLMKKYASRVYNMSDEQLEASRAQLQKDMLEQQYEILEEMNNTTNSRKK